MVEILSFARSTAYSSKTVEDKLNSLIGWTAAKILSIWCFTRPFKELLDIQVQRNYNFIRGAATRPRAGRVRISTQTRETGSAASFSRLIGHSSVLRNF